MPPVPVWFSSVKFINRPAMWNFISTFVFDLRIHACLLPSSFLLYKSSRFIFEFCCHFSYPYPPQENMAPQQRHPGRTPRTLTRNSLSSSGNSPLTSIQSSRSRHRHSARAQLSPLSGSKLDVYAGIYRMEDDTARL